MKKKIIFAIATGFFAVATVLNMNMLQVNSAGDISMEGIAVMAQAQSEQANVCDQIWSVTYSGAVGTDTKVEVTCSTGGSYVCPFCFWK
jgi:hypothetical protein